MYEYQKFKELVSKFPLSNEGKNDLILNFKSMFSTRNENKCIFIINWLEEYDFHNVFIQQSIKTKIKDINKSIFKKSMVIGLN